MPLGAHKVALFGVAGVSTGGDVVLLSTQTASDSASISFTSDITSTYGEYIFKFYNINPATNNEHFEFQVNATDGADYNDSAITSTYFYAYHTEDDSSATLTYVGGRDLAQGTGFQKIAGDIGSGSDENAAGELHLFNPSSTTYVKHFYSRINVYTSTHSIDTYVAGYINDTTAIDDIQFKMSSGNISSGTIKMWGVK